MAHCTSASFNGRPMRSARRSRQAPPKKVATFFNLSLVEKRRPRPNRRGGSPDTGDLRNFLAHLRVALLSRQGMAVMAGGEIVVDDKPSTSKSARRTLESMAERAGAKTAKPFPKPAPPKRDPRKRRVARACWSDVPAAQRRRDLFGAAGIRPSRRLLRPERAAIKIRPPAPGSRQGTVSQGQVTGQVTSRANQHVSAQ